MCQVKGSLNLSLVDNLFLGIGQEIRDGGGGM